MTTITLTKEHGYVLGVAVASVFVLQWMALKVGLARKAAHVEYPNMYATDTEAKENKAKFIFNCAQRGHQNTLENFPGFMILLVTSSISYPFYASLLGLIYLTGRVVYMLGYSKGDPKKRIRGAFQYIGLIGLAGLAIRTVFKLAL